MRATHPAISSNLTLSHLLIRYTRLFTGVGSGEASAIVQAIRALPQQQQLVLCAASKLLGQTETPVTETPTKPSTPQSQSKVDIFRPYSSEGVELN